MQRVKSFGQCCSVVGCSRRSGTNLLTEIKVYIFPKGAAQRDTWILAVKRGGWTPTSNARASRQRILSIQIMPPHYYLTEPRIKQRA
ncbi:hypothetical protein J4Q44_G00265470 [Coregonus suidteri]|uniref:THAP-type domain-containing protein n=1 Tax=Coregonus suidteri TaxID=861788 RepID=A0AAN8L044_9TELE